MEAQSRRTPADAAVDRMLRRRWRPRCGELRGPVRRLDSARAGNQRVGLPTRQLFDPIRLGMERAGTRRRM